MTAYYNEIDPFAAQHLRNLIAAGHIAPGIVDERSITEIKPDELRHYKQCHFFAGVGVWSRALRRAGWRDSRHVWTGSCPCQPFSSAGKGKGVEDDRHLWPAWFNLVSECQPSVIFGEQVASSEVIGKADGTGENVWIDIVSSDLEGALYAVAPFDLPAAGFGAPHIRQRIWFAAERMGDADTSRTTIGLSEQAQRQERDTEVNDNGGSGLPRPNKGRSNTSGMGNASVEPGKRDTGELPEAQGKTSREGRQDGHDDNGHPDAGEVVGMADCHSDRLDQGRERIATTGDDGAIGNCATERLADSKLQQRQESSTGSDDAREWHEEPAEVTGLCGDSRPGPTNGFWRDVDWLSCRDGKWRPVEPGVAPLVNGATQRVGRLRAYGNAICAEVAAGFISAYMGDNSN